MQQQPLDPQAAELDRYYKELYGKYYAQQVEALKSELDRLYAENVALREEKQRTTKQLERYSEVEAQAKVQIDALNAEKVSLNDFVGELRRTIEKIESTIGTLRRKLGKSRQQSEAYRSELFRVRRALEERITKLNELGELMRECEADSQRWQAAQAQRGAELLRERVSTESQMADTDSLFDTEQGDDESEKANLLLAAAVTERCNALQHNLLSLRTQFDTLLDLGYTRGEATTE